MDLNLILGISLMGNVFLIIFYVIFGPRKPRTHREIEKSLLDVTNALGYRLLMISLDNTKSLDENIDMYAFCKPEKVPEVTKIFSDNYKKPRDTPPRSSE